MATQLLTEKYAEHLDRGLGCYDQIVITGCLAELCYAKGMAHHLYAHNIRIFDYAHWAEPLREAIRTIAEAVAQAHGLRNDYISKKNFRQEVCWSTSSRKPTSLSCHLCPGRFCCAD